MAELFRLFVYSLAFGGGLVLLFWGLRLACHTVALIPPCVGVRAVRSAPRAGARGRRAVRFFSDFFAALLVSLLIIIFLFWQADGTPRLFVFLAIGLGAWLIHRTCHRLLARAERAFLSAFSFLLSRILRPIRAALRVLGGLFRRFLSKTLGLMIKTAKRTYTNHRIRRYMKRAPREMNGRRFHARLRAALTSAEERSYVG